MKYRLLLLAAAAIFATGGAAIKLTALTPWQVAGFRSGIAAAALLAGLPEARGGWSWPRMPVAAAYAATLVLFVLATKLTTAANAIFLQSSAPLYVLVLSPFLLGERIRRPDIAYILAAGTGVGFVFLGAETRFVTAPDPARGDVLALASGLAWALTLIGLRWIGRGGDAGSTLATVLAGNVIACIATLPMALPVSTIRGADVAVLVYLGVVQIGLAYVLLSRAIGHVPAFEATTILLVEPVMNPVWAWVVHGERPGSLSLLGGGVILAATLANARRSRTD